MFNLPLFNNKVKALSTSAGALYFAIRDARTSWYAKLVVIAVVVYAFSPFDFVPDYLPLLGWLDDFLIIGLGLRFARYLIPDYIWKESAVKAVPLENRVKKIYKALIWTLIALWIVVVLGAAGFLVLIINALVEMFKT